MCHQNSRSLMVFLQLYCSFHAGSVISRYYLIKRCVLFVSQGISSLLARGVYDSAFPLHDVSTTEIDTSRDSLENEAHVIHIFCLFVSQGSFTRRGRKDQRNDRQVS